MKQSPIKFREELQDKLLELLWQQWRTLGIASYGRETNHLLDLEALILATAAAGDYDGRLMAAALQWLHSFREWVNLARLKRMSAAFAKPDILLKKSLIKKIIWEQFSRTLNLATLLGSMTKGPDKPRADLVTTKLILTKASLLQLYLRSIFGVNARAEILLYLFLEAKGNSNQIAREIHYDQKNVYRILERWAEAGFISRESGKKQNLYSLDGGKDLLRNIKAPHSFWRWNHFFLLFARIIALTCAEPWSTDPYLLSSLFRDIYPEAAPMAKSVGITLPDINIHPGEELFNPMALALKKLLNCFLKT